MEAGKLQAVWSAGDGQADLLILTAGYGGGHRQVALAVAEAVAELEPALSFQVLDFFQAYSPLYARFTRFSYVTAVRHFPRAYGWFYRASSRVAEQAALREALTRLGWRRMLEIVASARPSVLVHTFPQTAAIHSALARRGRLRDLSFYTVVTDHTDGPEWIYPGTDGYFVSSPAIAQGLVRRGVEAGHVHATGIPLRRAFLHLPERAAARAGFGLDPGRPVLLLTGGALATLSGLPELLARIDRLPADFQLLAVAGDDAAAQRHLRQEARRMRHPVRAVDLLPDLAAAMSAADLVITKAGGVTTSEALAAGRPLLLVPPVPGQEAVNAAYLARHGAALVARDAPDLVARLELLLRRPEEADRLAQAARRLGRPAAALDVAAVLTRDPRLARARSARAAAPSR
ncbi:MAG: glycosyltransferase [Bacillota bacterium]|nr:glycosyltransferase [Bacillota bacterium]